MAPRPLPAALHALALTAALAVVFAALHAALELAPLASFRADLFLQVAAEALPGATAAAAGALLAWLLARALLAARLPSERGRALFAALVAGLPLGLLGLADANRAVLADFGPIERAIANLALFALVVSLLALAARGLRGWVGRLGRAPRAGLLALPLFVALLAAGRAARPEGPSALVILVDVLRADELGCYGYDRDTTPHVDRLAAEGVLFERALAQSSFTKTSVASLFTGRWPHAHGVFEGSQENSEGNIVSDVLDGRFTTLAESLSDAGYVTAAWVQNEQLRAFLGFDQGFDLYRDQPGDCETIFAEFLDWHAEWGRRPFFAYLHVLDLHAPYRPEPPWDERFVDLPEGYEPFTWDDWVVYKKRVRLGEIAPAPEEVERLRGLYDGQLAFIDDRVGALLDELRARGAYDELLVVFTADHGDAFMEHGALSHSNTPHEELIRVPLIAKLPGGASAGRRVDDVVALVDLAPTLEELLGAGGIGAHGDGISLARLLSGAGAALPPRRVLSMFKNKVAVRDGRWKLIQVFEDPPLLYDLETDPGETRDVAGEEPERTAELRALALDAIRRKLENRGETVELGEGSIQRLRELGYVE